ncbi:transglycosylase domain-containing protein [Saccharothrix saharensis]|uniref:transglycosylase domain-containing protein n=1 Tax=Saccharothrix saharensis TaxID=571190 RepID=UPI002482DBDB|nr:transglycosylase domain-containing protein [Saccharothrix saharensis]
MNDQHDDRHRGAEPQWPTGEDPDGGGHPPRRGAGDQPARPNTPPGGFARSPADGPGHGTPPGGFARPRTPPGGFPQAGGTPPGGIPRGGPPPRRPAGPGGPVPGGRPGGPPPPPGARPDGPRPDGQAAAGGVPGRPSTPPGGLRRPGAPGGPVPPGGRPPVAGPGGPRRPAGPGGPQRRPGEEPTDLLPPVYQSTPREPELLTHREDEVELEPFYDDDYDVELTAEEARVVRRKKVWRRVRRTSYVTLGLMLLAPVVAFAVAYQVVEVPNPEAVAASQGKAITVLYADGTEMTKIAPGDANRSMVKYEELPETLKQAVFAAEDPTFETNVGFDLTAIARAGWYQLKGEQSGGSGLTQQYVKEATDQDDMTLTRKFTEAVTAYKMSQQQDKRDILTAYMNTIYFGRGGYGIKTAVKAYFGDVQLKDLTHSQAALLAGLIQNPGRSEQQAYRDERWNYVMDQMLKHGWIDQTYRTTEPMPVPVELTDQSGLSGPRLHIREQVIQEMAKVEWDVEKAQKVGVTVHTTIEPPKQAAAEQAVADVMGPQPKELRSSLTAIDPQTGAVRAYYAGADGTGLDYATNTLQEAGSSFKPFDLVAALKAGKGLGSTYDGRSPKKFDLGGTSITIRNASDPTNKCGEKCSIRKAMELSLNTVFYEMVIDIGTQPVADAARAAGIPPSVEVQGVKKDLLVGENGGPPNVGIALGGGEAQVRPFDMASAYATFAARGTYHEPFFISKITNAEGKAVYQHVDVSRQAFDPDPKKNQDIADNVTEALRPIPKSSSIPCAGRECAGKTGTHELPDDATQNSKAWMVGYTPSLSAAVWVGRDEGNVALKNAEGKPVFGSGLPGQIWKRFMDKALEGTPAEPFPKPAKLNTFDDPKPTTTTTTTTTTTDKKDEDNRPTTTDPTTTRQSTPTTTRTGRPCQGLVCPTEPTTTTNDQPDPGIGNGAAPTG